MFNFTSYSEGIAILLKSAGSIFSEDRYVGSKIELFVTLLFQYLTCTLSLSVHGKTIQPPNRKVKQNDLGKMLLFSCLPKTVLKQSFHLQFDLPQSSNGGGEQLQQVKLPEVILYALQQPIGSLVLLR